LIPLRDNQPTSTFPIITILLIALNVLVYIGQQVLPLDSSWSLVPYEITHNTDLNNVVARLSASEQPHLYQLPPNTLVHLGPHDIYYGPSPHPLWLTVFTAMFMHGSLLHIGGNMLYLWIFGNNIEDALGKARFLVFYLTCGVAATAAQIAIDPNSLIPNVGASGAIAGVLGAYFILYPNARVLSIVPVFIYFFAEIRAYWVLLVWIGLQLFQGFMGLGMQRGGGVAYFAHIGGFFAGILLISLMGGQALVAKQRRQTPYYPPPGGSY
jgi:membrane associated rhomboid family serine protease